MEEQHLKAFTALPPSSSCRIINFETAQVVPGFFPKTLFLIVTGVKPWVTMTVELRPLIYIKQPEYWGIEVVVAVTVLAFHTVCKIFAASQRPNEISGLSYAEVRCDLSANKPSSQSVFRRGRLLPVMVMRPGRPRMRVYVP